MNFCIKLQCLYQQKQNQKSDNACPWSDEFFNELLYEVAAQLSDEEQEDRMDTSKPLATLLQPPKHGCTTKDPR